MPMSLGGGLIGGGRPVGAAGVRTLVDGARAFATLDIGGSTATAVRVVVSVREAS
jgi:acetyl-CoA C-acetyltransferase